MRPASTQRSGGEGGLGRGSALKSVAPLTIVNAAINVSLRLTLYCRNPSGGPTGAGNDQLDPLQSVRRRWALRADRARRGAPLRACRLQDDATHGDDRLGWR